MRATTEDEGRMRKATKSKSTVRADEIAYEASRGQDVSAYFTNKFSVVKPVQQIFDSRIKDPDLDQLLRVAITRRRLLRLQYKGKERIVEPHDYGVHKGVVKLLCYQIGGSSTGRLPNWRWMETDRISEAEMLDRTFEGGRPTELGKHHHWDELFIRVESAHRA